MNEVLLISCVRVFYVSKNKGIGKWVIGFEFGDNLLTLVKTLT